ncbi:MAG: TetR/AcrR family transcriptional regulator [Parvibaculum sp.]|uniref:TetR/AcrR family transcriptional regulator n=1 Tax=Parvibaculum sp. TaxID=2024848 RepID=UPI0025EA4812|nr:TetR/AcrR family transcriptional regulator [Parvibaculum sp.]MCE9651342.1 TetR/AcrR family transcriptional regulator [Parvibaculum sp.]
MASEPVDLAVKRAPRQKRAVETYERILDVATRLLAEVGVERISTNLIAAEAGIKIPTLYRYFPNKYAVLMALGDRLMTHQNDVIVEWLARDDDTVKPEALIEDIGFLIDGTIAATRDFPGALSIMLALRAVPTLQNVRLGSHRMMTDIVVERLLPRLPHVARDELWPRIRLSVELIYAAVEMALEEPKVDAATVGRETGIQIQIYWRDWLTSSYKE